VLRKIFGCRRDEVAGEWRRWRNEDIRDLYFLQNIILDVVGAYSGL